MRERSGYPASQRLLEHASIALFALLAAWSAARLLAASGPWFPLLVLAAAPLAWLASDLLSGLVHWALDSFGSVRTPLVGAAFIRPFREHHVDPAAMTRHDFVETNGSSCFAALPLLMVSLWFPVFSPGELFISTTTLMLALGALATNQCHKWAHMEEAAIPRAIRWAQRRGLLIPPEQHRRHHTAPFDSHFCMSCGWLNRPFDALLRAGEAWLGARR